MKVTGTPRVKVRRVPNSNPREFPSGRVIARARSEFEISGMRERIEERCQSEQFECSGTSITRSNTGDMAGRMAEFLNKIVAFSRSRTFSV